MLLGQKLIEEKTEFADAWNFGPNYEQCVSVERLLNLLQQKWDQIIWEHQPNSANVHEANLLKLDSSKAQNNLNWHSILGIEGTIEMTISWYRSYYEENKIDTSNDIDKYSTILQTVTSNVI